MTTLFGDGNPGVFGHSVFTTGVHGRSDRAWGVHGQCASFFNTAGRGVVGEANRGIGVHGHCNERTGVLGSSGGNGYGVHGFSPSNHGVVGETRGVAAGVVGHNSATGGFDRPGVRGISDSSDLSSPGVKGECTQGGAAAVGVLGQTPEGYGVRGISTRIGVYGRGVIAGDFEGDVRVSGTITGNKAFQIDHPLDPANSYLNHASVESPERKNVYDGVAQLDEAGTASVELPEWFEALNRDFRYQLTAVGGAAPNLHVAEEIYENNRFRIAGGEGGMKVCWQVTGTRKDPWAAANPFVVEEDKPQEERGRYLQPDLYGAPEEQSVMRARMGEDMWQQMMREEPPSYEPSQLPEMPPQAPEMPPGYDFGRLEEEHRQQEIADLRGQIEEQRRGRLEEEIDELRRQIKKLRRRR